jgi:hypothetical protein
MNIKSDQIHTKSGQNAKICVFRKKVIQPNQVYTPTLDKNPNVSHVLNASGK